MVFWKIHESTTVALGGNVSVSQTELVCQRTTNVNVILRIHTSIKVWKKHSAFKAALCARPWIIIQSSCCSRIRAIHQTLDTLNSLCLCSSSSWVSSLDIHISVVQQDKTRLFVSPLFVVFSPSSSAAGTDSFYNLLMHLHCQHLLTLILIM